MQERDRGHGPAPGGEARAWRGGGDPCLGGGRAGGGRAEQRRRVTALLGRNERIHPGRQSDYYHVQGRVVCGAELAECPARCRLPELRLVLACFQSSGLRTGGVRIS